jgi:hypothetical protein
MDYQDERTAYGRLMYSLEMGWVRFLSGHIWLWYVLNLTWGLPGTLIGACIALFVRVFLCRGKPVRYRMVREFDFGSNWGGLEGVFFIFVSRGMGDAWEEHTREHELGHSFQNALLGPFNLFLTFIPSMLRYWAQRLFPKRFGKPYDLIWFEGSATDGGHYYASR